MEIEAHKASTELNQNIVKEAQSRLNSSRQEISQSMNEIQNRDAIIEQLKE